MYFNPLQPYDSIKQTVQVLTPTERVSMLAIFDKQIEEPETTRHLAGQFTVIAELEEKVEETFRCILSDVAWLGQCAKSANMKSTWFNHYKAFRAQVTESRKVAHLVRHHLNEFLEIVAPVITDMNGAKDEVGRKEAINTLTDFIQDLPKNIKANGLNTLSKTVDQPNNSSLCVRHDLRLSVTSLIQLINVRRQVLALDAEKIKAELHAWNQERVRYG
ncbi:unnamed protein product [Rhizoctonia solani]|uniref:Uncharacterized protein n=1 Tax=Rhizoctonia solani TaxID=456999 RepID=A0A8H3CQG7_9AGAM|nr:unnamed protein product [Rhizoctonia solani]CAE7093416.1 unnamed protein product [Rhizoctonia solani]